ncbi:hypothetical protein [Ideonella sp.]|uniref:hypothetical protein n=1 Tax=Ideonella sp. TaxID=1929293 RepID=UPI0035B1A1B4
MFTIGAKGDGFMLQHQRSGAQRVAASLRACGASLAGESRGAAPSAESGWLESSWDLSHGLEISDLDGELAEEFVRHLTSPPD